MSELKKAPQSSMGETGQVDVDALMAEYDRESNTRHFSGIPKVVVRYILVAFSLYVFYMNLISVWPEQIRRASFVGLVVFMAFTLYPSRKKTTRPTKDALRICSRSEEHTSELQSRPHLVCRLLLEKKKTI